MASCSKDAEKCYYYKVMTNLYTSGSVHERYHMYLISQAFDMYFG